MVYNNNNDRLAGISAALNTIIGHKHQRDSIHGAVDFLIPPTSPKQQRDRRGWLLLLLPVVIFRLSSRQMTNAPNGMEGRRHPSSDVIRPKNRKKNQRLKICNDDYHPSPSMAMDHLGSRIKKNDELICMRRGPTAGLFPSI